MRTRSETSTSLSTRRAAERRAAAVALSLPRAQLLQEPPLEPVGACIPVARGPPRPLPRPLDIRPVGPVSKSHASLIHHLKALPGASYCMADARRSFFMIHPCFILSLWFTPL